MKIAHLILVHKNPKQVRMLVENLRHPDCDIFIHVDKKSDIHEFYKQVCLIDRIWFIKKRALVQWAGFGTIEAITNGFKEIDKSKYRYINVISGQDFPIMNSNKFVEYLRLKDGSEFITCESILDKWKQAAPRVKKYHLINFGIPGKYKIEKFINAILPERKFPLDYEIVGRANWFTLTNDSVNYYLNFIETHREVVSYFKLCWGADEFIFSTILFNSPFKKCIYPNLMYVDWSGCINGHPRILGIEDYHKIMTSGYYFARKFDMELDRLILDKIECEI